MPAKRWSKNSEPTVKTPTNAPLRLWLIAFLMTLSASGFGQTVPSPPNSADTVRALTRVYRKAVARGDSLARDTATLGGIVRNLERSRVNDRRLWNDSTRRATQGIVREARGRHRREGAFGLLLLQAAVVVLVKIL